MSDNNVMKGGLGTGLLILSAAVMVATFGYVIFQLNTVGHAAFNVSSKLPWGQPISTYLYFALASSGLGLIASLPLVFGFKQYYGIAKRAIFLAFIILISGMAVLALELGHTFRMLWAIPFNMQIQSAMFWMGVFYAADLLFLLWKFQKMEAGDWDSKNTKIIGIASFLGVLLASGNLALIFGMMSMRPFWFDGSLPIYFYLTAVTSGMAALVFFSYLAYGFDRSKMPQKLQNALNNGLPKLFAAVLGLTILFVAVRAITGLYTNNPEVYHVWADYLFASPVYILSLLLGLLVPFALMMSRNLRVNPQVQVLVSVLTFGGLFAERYFFVVGGQVIPLFQGTWAWNMIQYTPSATEWALTIMGSAMIFTLYVLGEKFFNLSAVPEQLEEAAEAEAKATA
ncbi:NrfD/PsrC family molybdoenzyme membrane anchor subunit [Alkalilimnicola ehrlichii MLHE-1]|uniref:Polysulphide reductase, NrfD n=1 Tax=Alkalilimnicola ehrlichii (strain ATCC BAA-1101 / DSM 17681 / MLHE-1) TaxID=187272 RepID=Q0AC68_ALKEH|nr:NrfD/PsrC family molybdoenzyme membrane anchor subunit [Alkalilimnicola ehrlichii]ABI55569.1 Polysulphide reductase, NrfD [Alkalilimnicola ehrlichii MLHE-1]